MLTRYLATLLLAILVLAGADGAALRAQEATESPETPRPAEQLAALHSDALARLPEIDREIAAALAQGRAACDSPWEGARLNRAADPYSLALHQEGRSRRDPTAAAMRNTQKGVAYFRLLNTKLIGRWDKLDSDLGLARTRFVDSLRKLEELKEVVAADDVSRRSRENVAAELGELSSALKALEGGITRGQDHLAEHREEWAELLSQAREADPGSLELQPRTREKGELMLAEFRAMDEGFLALAASSEKHFGLMGAEIDPLLEQVDGLRKFYKPARR